MSPSTIMIVEDNELLASMYTFKLEKEGFSVQLISNWLEATRHLRSAEKMPDLILLDLMMPNMNGFEVLENIRNTHSKRQTKIIIFSNLNEPKDREKCLSLGADEFLLKANTTPGELVIKIKSILGL